MLSYMPRNIPRHEYVTITPEGLRYRTQMFTSVNSLIRWFKEHFRDPIPGEFGFLWFLIRCYHSMPRGINKICIWTDPLVNVWLLLPTDLRFPSQISATILPLGWIGSGPHLLRSGWWCDFEKAWNNFALQGVYQSAQSLPDETGRHSLGGGGGGLEAE